MDQEIAFGILKTGRNVFLTGSAGTGKTYLLNQYIQYLKERNIKPTIVAPTGIAASHIGGMTIHSFFGIGIREYLDDYAIDSLLQKEFLYKRFEKLKVLIIDEISMVSPLLFTSINKILQTAKFSDKPFGGVQVILSGDFFQLPPISRQKNDIKFAYQTKTWEDSNLRFCYLKEKFRQDDETLINILDEIRSNAISKNSMKVFDSCHQKKLSNDFEVTKLYTHNIDVDRINNTELEKLSDRMQVFISKNKGSKKNVEKIFKSSLVVEELKLKKGASVIFIKNNYEKGYINGTLGKVINFHQTTGMPIVKIFSGHIITTEPEDWAFENTKGEIKATINQIPLKLAWALTIHKSQGMTLDAAEMDLSKTFEVGQGYVALSRIKSIDGLRLMGLNDIALQVDKRVIDTYKEIRKLSDLNVKKFKSFSKVEKEVMNNDFITKNNGKIHPVKSGEVSLSETEFNRVQKINTLEITKQLLSQKKTIAQISKKRNISENTILQHVEKIAKIYPDLSLSYLKPTKKDLNKVTKAVKAIQKANRPDNFLANKKIKLRAIFKHLKESLSYETIKLALIFINTE